MTYSCASCTVMRNKGLNKYYGSCHRRPPDSVTNTHPIVKLEGWCGEHEQSLDDYYRSLNERP